MELIARKRQVFGGQVIAKGDPITASPRLGRTLVALGRADAVQASSDPADPPVRVSERTGQPVRQYKRRDLRAEGSAA